MSFAFAFLAAGLAVLWLPAAVLLGFALYLGAWCVGLLALGCALGAARAVWGAVECRIPVAWGLYARLGVAFSFGLVVALAMLGVLVLYSVGVRHA